MEDLGASPDPRLLEKFGRRFVAGDVLFREGDVGNEAFLLQEGRVRLLKRVRTVERSLMVLKPGDLFGESVECPLQGAAFCIRTGAVESFPATVPLRTYEVQVVGDDVQIDPTPRPLHR